MITNIYCSFNCNRNLKIYLYAKWINFKLNALIYRKSFSFETIIIIHYLFVSPANKNNKTKKFATMHNIRLDEKLVINIIHTRPECVYRLEFVGLDCKWYQVLVTDFFLSPTEASMLKSVYYWKITFFTMKIF